MAFGVIQALGGGFAFGPIERLRGGISGSSLLATFSLGAVYGFAGFCSGPILGAVLTVAATSGSALRGAGLLATYAAGMAAPLFLMALLWDRLDLGRRRWLRGREISLRSLRLHTTNLLSGLMFVAIRSCLSSQRAPPASKASTPRAVRRTSPSPSSGGRGASEKAHLSP
jgi:cytochrome c biogenesis protein CcdA